MKLSLFIKKSKSNWAEGKKIEIYPTGFDKTKRQTDNDQITYFGQKNMDCKQHDGKCDIYVNTSKNPSEYGAHFFIKYDYDYLGYYMKDLNKGALIHYTLMETQKIVSKMTVQFGNTVLMLRARIVLPQKQDHERSAITQSVFSNHKAINSTFGTPPPVKAKSEKLNDPNLYE